MRLILSGGEGREGTWPQNGPFLSFTPASEREAGGPIVRGHAFEAPSCCSALGSRARSSAGLGYPEPERPRRETSGWAPLSFAQAPVLSASCPFGPGLVLQPRPLGKGPLPSAAGGRPPGGVPCTLPPSRLALWLCRHGCHTVIASRSLPRVSQVRGLSCVHPTRGWLWGSPEAQKMVTPKPIPPK